MSKKQKAVPQMLATGAQRVAEGDLQSRIGSREEKKSFPQMKRMISVNIENLNPSSRLYETAIELMFLKC